MQPSPSLAVQVADQLRNAIEDGKYKPGEQLPTESELAKEYAVSRPTIRSALRDLRSESIVFTQRGVGTFVKERQPVQAGLERLDSITESIRSIGMKPGMRYQSRLIRPLMPEEAAKLDLSAHSEAVEIRRTILADDQIVAYSYDLIPLGVFPEGENPEVLDGSLFQYLKRERGLYPAYAVAEIHAVSSDHVGWEDPGASSLYVLLDQVHYTSDRTALLYSRTYFLEGRYTFKILRNA